MALGGRTRSTRGLVIILVTVSLVTITVDYREGDRGPLAKIGEVALSVVTPLQKAVTTVTRPIGNFFVAIAHAPSLENRINELQRQLRSAHNEVAKTQSFRVEYARLLKLLHLQTTLHLDSKAATVISSGVSNFEWSVNIDKGTNDGVRRGMAVVADGGLVGTVTKSGPFSSTVTLVIDPGVRVAARLVVSQETGELVGQGGQSDLRLDLIGQGTPVMRGEPVETFGFQGSLYPPGIPIGEVSAVHSDPAAGEQDITVRPAVDFSSLQYVLVVLSPGSR